MADKVIPIRPNTAAWDDGLLSLPACVIQACSRCGRNDGGWISKNLGCQACAPENEQGSFELSAMGSKADYYEDQHTRLLEAAREVVKAPFPRVVTKLREVIALWDYNERQRLAAAPTPEGSDT